MKVLNWIGLFALGLVLGQISARAASKKSPPPTPKVEAKKSEASSNIKTETAILAAGCFWGVEEFFRKMDGVISTEVGYSGGSDKKPTYDAVSEGKTGHAESVRIVFDPKKISYEQILTQFFKMHDPTTLNRQGNDEGTQYRSAIFTTTNDQKETAKKLMARIEKSKAWGKPLTTTVNDEAPFYAAEDYHQKYLVKHPGGYDNHYVRSINF